MNAHGYKTNSRTRIMEFLQMNKDRTVTVSDIEEHLSRENSGVNKTTIYRYLDRLEADGNVIKYTAEKGEKAAYQYVDREHKCDEHLHLKCTECGAIIHLDCGFMDEIAHHIEVEHGFKLQCRNSIIYGVCARCQKLQKE